MNILDLITDLLRVIGPVIMKHTFGAGYWQYERKPISDPLKGLTRGQMIFTYDEDIHTIVRELVASVDDDGVGYYLRGNIVFPIDATFYFLTKEDACKATLDEALSLLEYSQENCEKAQRIIDVAKGAVKDE